VSLPVFPRTRVIYVYAVVIISLMLMAIFWFIFQQIVEAIQISSRSLANSFGSTSPTYTLADQFISNIFTYFLVLMLIGMTYWAYIYSQRKGGEF
jgi:hypothetical protein